MKSAEHVAREEIVTLGRALYDRGLTPGRTGNLSVKVGHHLLITPTGASLGRLSAPDISVIDLDGAHIGGPAPTKETALHLTLYRRDSSVNAVAHGHTTYAVAWSCRPHLDADNAIPPLTAYFAMRVGRLPLIGYARPGDPVLAKKLAVVDKPCALLANHGSITSGANLEAAVDALEEIEETARIAFLLETLPSTPLTDAQVRELGM